MTLHHDAARATTAAVAGAGAPASGADAPMTAACDTVDDCLHAIGWSTNELAFRLGINPRTAGRMRAGRAPCPSNVLAWLQKLARCHLQHELPVGWQMNAAHDGEQPSPD